MGCPEATEAATAAPRRIARTRTHGYEPMREAVDREIERRQAERKRKPKRR